MYTPSFSTPNIVSRTAPRRDDSQTIKIVPSPQPVCPPTPPPATQPARPMVSEPAPPPQPRDDVPTRPLPIDLRAEKSDVGATQSDVHATAAGPRAAHKNKLGRLAIKKVPATAAIKTPVPATQPAVEPKRAVREGALLDPFGRED